MKTYLLLFLIPILCACSPWAHIYDNARDTTPQVRPESGENIFLAKKGNCELLKSLKISREDAENEYHKNHIAVMDYDRELAIGIKEYAARKTRELGGNMYYFLDVPALHRLEFWFLWSNKPLNVLLYKCKCLIHECLTN